MKSNNDSNRDCAPQNVLRRNGIKELGISRSAFAMWLLALMSIALLVGVLYCGTVDLAAANVTRALRELFTGTPGVSIDSLIVTEVRLPMGITAFMAGVGLSLAGLLLQTTFNNPLAGPSILGISTGASLGVAIVMLLFGGWLGSGIGYYTGIMTGAFAGAALVMVLLLGFSMLLRGNTMLLIMGILIGYLASSAISLLNFFSTQQGVHSYVIWGMGNFSGLNRSDLAVMVCAVALLTVGAMLMVKPLNALLLGREYAESMGVDVKRSRNILLLISGLFTAVVTAFCGPIGFLGLVMPHVARMITGTSNHRVLLPATALAGGCGGLLCCWLSVVCGGGQIIPVNAITPLISVPVIIYVILNRKKL
jgi:iron complex transport system permease protein